ncbi:hypothetical protein AC1031_005552 [Aphanomyces cochlioides]|nr:hypothetical protein AC1031_005552 [Aphanomyces cochlioides]
MVSASTTIAAALLATTTYVDAHGTLFKPSLKFTGSNYAGDFFALVPMTALKPQPGDIFNYPDANLNAAALSRPPITSRSRNLSKGRFSNPKTPECGFTDPNGPVVPLPDQLEWYGGQMNHPGPCEVWCDDELVVPFNTNCAEAYPKGIIPYDKAKCVGKNRLTLYWMSTLLEWQVYTDCAHIGNGKAPTPSTAAPTPRPSPSTPRPTSPTPPSSPPTPSTSPRAPTSSSPATFAPRPTPAPGSQTTLLPTAKPSQNNSTTMPPCGDGKLSVYKQCGGDHYSGPTECKDGLVCHKWSDCYWQCIPIRA